jgi:hypothetical protein
MDTKRHKKPLYSRLTAPSTGLAFCLKRSILKKLFKIDPIGRTNLSDMLGRLNWQA